MSSTVTVFLPVAVTVLDIPVDQWSIVLQLPPGTVYVHDLDA